MAKRLAFLFLSILFFTFSLGEIARIQFPDGISINALDIGVLVFVVASALVYRKQLLKAKIKKPIIIFSSVVLISLVVNFFNLKLNELAVSSLYAVRWIFFTGVYLAIQSFDTKLKENTTKLALVFGTLVLFLGFSQYLLYPNLANLYYLGWDEHLYRLFSSFLDPNFAGAFFVLFFLFILSLFWEKKNLLLGMLGVFDLVATVLTYSRSAYLMLLVGLLTFLILKGKKKFLLIFIAIFAVTILVLSLGGLKSEGTNLLRITSTEARIPSAKNALTIFQKNPLFGVGFNTYEFASKKYGLSKTSRFPNHAGAGTDNSFLFILATTGIVGFAAYVYLLFKVISISKKSAVIISSVIALIVDSLFINSLFYTFIMLWMWVIVGLEEN